jgi:hypothetical protein
MSTSTDPGKKLDWEPYSVLHLAKDPVYVPDVELPNEDIMTLLEHPPSLEWGSCGFFWTL